MSLNDPIADLLTRIRNATLAKLESCRAPYSTLKAQLLKVLQNEGFIRGYEVETKGQKKDVIITLKYTADRLPVFSDLQRVSKPGRRVYISNDHIRPLRQGAGISIVSTPKGVMKDTDAQRAGVGGEVLCTIW